MTETKDKYPLTGDDEALDVFLWACDRWVDSEGYPFDENFDHAAKIIRELRARLAEAEKERDRYRAAWNTLMEGELSRGSGGDPGMVFDEFDYAVERARQGTVTFDRDAVDKARAALEGGDDGS